MQFQQDIIENKIGNHNFGIVTFKDFYDLFIFLKNNYEDNIFNTEYFKTVEKTFLAINSGISNN